MNPHMFKAIGLSFLLICANASADPDDAAGPDDPACAAIKASPAFESFVQSYIAAINSKKPEVLWACYYPKSVQILAKDKEYADAVCEDSFSDSIPATYEVALKALKPSDVNKMETDEGTTYPIRPTVQMGIRWKLGKGEESEGGLLLVLDGGKWYAVVGTRPTK